MCNNFTDIMPKNIKKKTHILIQCVYAKTPRSGEVHITMYPRHICVLSTGYDELHKKIHKNILD